MAKSSYSLDTFSLQDFFSKTNKMEGGGGGRYMAETINLFA